MTRMRKFATAALASAISLYGATSTFGQASATTDAQGAEMIEILGEATPLGKVNFINLGFIRQQAYQGILESSGTTEVDLGSGLETVSTISDTQASWSADQFNGAESGDVGGAHFVEIASGPNAGTLVDVVDTDGSTLILAEDLSAMIAGDETFKVYKHWTLESVFGVATADDPNQTPLNGAASASAADEVFIFNPVTQAPATYYYQAGSFVGGEGWRRSGDLFTDQRNLVLYPDHGVIVRRKVAETASLIITGLVKRGGTVLPVENNFNLVALPYPAGTLTLGTSNLIEAGLSVGASASAADDVRIYNGTGFTSYYFQQGSFVGGEGWRQAGDLFTDQADTAIGFDAFLIIQRKSGGAFLWDVAQPYPDN